MQNLTSILAFFSGADFLIISIIFLIPVALVLTLVVTSSSRRKENLNIQNTQTLLLGNILDELKKLNSNKH